PVAVRAQIGDMFPPLELVRSMSDSQLAGPQVLIGKSSRIGRNGLDVSQVMHVGIRMSESDLAHHGNLPPSSQAEILRRIEAELERKFELEIVRRKLVGDFAFVYPYLQNSAGKLVFCRIEVKDHISATRRTSFVSSFFHQS
ncbi:MAG: hypothetical protein WBW38_19760, partial [Candidatus Sulfotelmatobacter sp.]